MSSLEPLQQSVLNTSLVAQPQVEIRMSDWKLVINPVQDITPYGRPMEGTTYPEHPALGVSLDSGLMEGITRSVTRPDGGSIREFAKWVFPGRKYLICIGLLLYKLGLSANSQEVLSTCMNVY